MERFVTGPIETNTYLLINDTGMVVIDPSSGCSSVLKKMADSGKNAESILLTHGHFDHILGIPELQKNYPGMKVYCPPGELPLVQNPDYNGSAMIGGYYSYNGPIEMIREGAVTIGSFEFEILSIPGHSPEGCAILIENYCFCGDILFAGSIGRSDLPGGDGDLLVAGIKKKILTLPDTTIICSGHGGRTTLAREKKFNPFLVD